MTGDLSGIYVQYGKSNLHVLFLQLIILINVWYTNRLPIKIPQIKGHTVKYSC